MNNYHKTHIHTLNSFGKAVIRELLVCLLPRDGLTVLSM